MEMEMGWWRELGMGLIVRFEENPHRLDKGIPSESEKGWDGVGSVHVFENLADGLMLPQSD